MRSKTIKALLTMRPAHAVCEPDAFCYGSDGLNFKKLRFPKANRSYRLILLMRTFTATQLSGKPQCEARFVQTFYWHRNDTTHFENYDKAQKYLLGTAFLRSSFRNNSHAITLSAKAHGKLTIVHKIGEANAQAATYHASSTRSVRFWRALLNFSCCIIKKLFQQQY